MCVWGGVGWWDCLEVFYHGVFLQKEKKNFYSHAPQWKKMKMKKINLLGSPRDPPT